MPKKQAKAKRKFNQYNNNEEEEEEGFSENEEQQPNEENDYSDNDDEEELKNEGITYSSILSLPKEQIEILEQKVESNLIGYPKEFQFLIKYYQRKLYEENQYNNRNEEDSHVKYLNKLRSLRWTFTQNLFSNETFWKEWLLNEEQEYKEQLIEKKKEENTVLLKEGIKQLYRKALRENPSFSEISKMFCSFILTCNEQEKQDNSNKEEEEDEVIEIFEWIIDLPIGTNIRESSIIYEMYIDYLRRIGKKEKIIEIYKRQFLHPHLQVINTWKNYSLEFGKNKEEGEIPMENYYSKCLMELEERLPFEDKLDLNKENKNLLNNYLEYINFELERYNDLRKESIDNNKEENNEDNTLLINLLLNTQYKRLVNLLERCTLELYSKEEIWIKYLTIIEKLPFDLKINNNYNFMESEFPLPLLMTSDDEAFCLQCLNLQEDNQSNIQINKIDQFIRQLIKNNINNDINLMDYWYFNFYLKLIEIVMRASKAIQWSSKCWILLMRYLEQLFTFCLKVTSSSNIIEDKIDNRLINYINNNIIDNNLIIKWFEMMDDLMYNKALRGLNTFADNLVFNDYYELFSYYCTFLVRMYNNKILNIKFNNSLENTITLLNQTFENCVNYLIEYFSKDKNKNYLLELQWIEFIKEIDLISAKELFENYILQSTLHQKYINMWKEYLNLIESIDETLLLQQTKEESQYEEGKQIMKKKKSSKIEMIRSIYQEGMKKIDKNVNRISFIKDWIQFEKCKGNNLEELLNAERQLERLKHKQEGRKKEKKHHEKKNLEEKKGEKKKKTEEKKEKVDKKKQQFNEKNNNKDELLKDEMIVEEVEPKSSIPEKKVDVTVSTTTFSRMEDEIPITEKTIVQEEKTIEKTKESTNKEVKDNKEEETGKQSKKEKSKNVAVWNLPFSYKEENIKQLFEKYNLHPKRITIITRENGHSKGFAFIEMLNDEDIDLSIKNLHDLQLDEEGHKLKVERPDVTKMKRILKKQNQLNSSKKEHKKKRESKEETKKSEEKRKPMFKPRSVQQPATKKKKQNSESNDNEANNQQSKFSIG
ncbi:hypothetical protein ABK040_013515 [Willaertia magna]